MKNDLILLSGADIPFIEGTITIHQPSIYEISMLGEEVFFTGCELLRFSKDILISEDKSRLINQDDFNILMSIINDKSGSMTFNISCAKQVLALMLPLYTLRFKADEIQCWDYDGITLCGGINSSNFIAFKELLIEMFCLKKTTIAQDYNVQSQLAKQIADKFKQRRQKLADLQSSNSGKKVSIFNKYISILTVGEHKDMNSFMKYTVYQLLDEYQRFELKVGYDMYIKARMAGAKDLQEPEDWMKDIHSS